MVKPIMKQLKTKFKIIGYEYETKDWVCNFCGRDITGGAWGVFPTWLCSWCEFELRHQVRKQNTEAIERFLKKEEDINNQFKKQLKDGKRKFLWIDGQYYTRLELIKICSNKCQYCNVRNISDLLHIHHESYKPEKVKVICKGCHFKSHFTPEEIKKKYVLLQEQKKIKANIWRDN